MTTYLRRLQEHWWRARRLLRGVSEHSKLLAAICDELCRLGLQVQDASRQPADDLADVRAPVGLQEAELRLQRVRQPCRILGVW
jgi:hypothetical protein